MTLVLRDDSLLASGLPREGKEYARSFSGFTLMGADQDMICYHKKNIIIKSWKDIGSGIELFLCRKKDMQSSIDPDFISLCRLYGEVLTRDGIIQGIQVHIPLTSTFLGKEDYFVDIVQTLREAGYIVVQSLIQTKDFPLIQRSITDPALLGTLVPVLKDVENTEDLSISSAQADRRDSVVSQLVEWCNEQKIDTSLLDEYDIALLKCDM